MATPISNMMAPTALRLAPPEKFSGDSGDCRTFLVQCDLHFKLNPGAFMNRLSEPIKDQLASLDLPWHLEAIISRAIRVDNRLWEKEQCQTAVLPPSRWGHATGIQPLRTSLPPALTTSVDNFRDIVFSQCPRADAVGKDQNLSQRNTTSSGKRPHSP